MRDPARNIWTEYEPEATGSELYVDRADALSDPDVEDLLPSALSLWPKGAAWGSPDGQAIDEGSNWARLTRALLAPVAELYRLAFEESKEWFVLSLRERLVDWEREYGLPSDCARPNQSYETRFYTLLNKVRSTGTITPQDFVRLAHFAGFRIKIEERFAFRCGFSRCGGEHFLGGYDQEAYWVVHVYDLRREYFRVGKSRVGRDPLFEVVGMQELICLFEAVEPAPFKAVFRLVGEAVPTYTTWPEIWHAAPWGIYDV
ncbi:putative phage tail protein [Aurantimonas sp. 22II-16-19i]|uniref:putative phage tail protein n=1 Tax=Aurantimonas sp. 22II-16-19i TaxID=1317114 RepID=UPI0009F7A0D0|nr:putative phage tail protein [Aurantimonas sp. 22II-16-19i]ORE91010.1 hypothetical protein ATO4_20149 [Aurantimonas sp. 22II-16-19i]